MELTVEPSVVHEGTQKKTVKIGSITLAIPIEDLEEIMETIKFLEKLGVLKKRFIETIKIETTKNKEINFLIFLLIL